VFLDTKGKRLTPVYNYLKSISPSIQNALFEKYGGESEFCRKTGSPQLGNLLNSGIQILWLKKEHPEIFNKVSSILHLPQYLAYLFTHKLLSDSTSIGCHTFLWDFDKNQYHSWLKDEGIKLPKPEPNTNTININLEGEKLVSGIGIHDSSSSLVPYLFGSKTQFLLISTGTWCINMNPFNRSPLTHDQLENDCLFFLSIHKKPVKASRFFMGHIHDVNTKRLASYFNVPVDYFKKIKTNKTLIEDFLAEGSQSKIFFKNGIPVNYIDEQIDLSLFSGFSEAYHRFIFDLVLLNTESIDLILTNGDDIKRIYVTGGFARNEIFVSLLANFFPDKKVFTSKVDNASALGAALVLTEKKGQVSKPDLDLGLKRIRPF
jgi:sugar (pentulose or hexulose) kinase